MIIMIIGDLIYLLEYIISQPNYHLFINIIISVMVSGRSVMHLNK